MIPFGPHMIFRFVHTRFKIDWKKQFHELNRIMVVWKHIPTYFMTPILLKIRGESPKSVVLGFSHCMYILSSSDNMARSPIYDALCSKWVQPFKSPKFLLFPFRDWSWHCLLSPLFCHHLNNPYWFCMVFQPRFEPSDLFLALLKEESRKCMCLRPP